MADNKVEIDILINAAKSATTVRELKKSLDDLKTAQKNVDKETKTGAQDFDKLNKAIDGTKKKTIEAIVQQAKSAKSIGELRRSMKDLALAQEEVDKSSPEFGDLAESINEVEGRIGDLNDTMKTFSGSGVERLTSSTGLLQEGIQNLDFDKIKVALGGLKQLPKALSGEIDKLSGALSKSNLNFKSLGSSMKTLSGSGVGTLSKSIIQLGRSILTNPVLILPGVIITLIAVCVRFYDKIIPLRIAFDAVGKAIDFVVQSLKDFTDAIGLTNFAEEKAAENSLTYWETRKAKVTEAYDAEIAKAQAAGSDTYTLERKKLLAVQQSVMGQITSINKLKLANGKLTADQIKELKDLKAEWRGLSNEIEVVDIKHSKSLKDKAKEDAKTASEAAKKKKEVRDKEVAEYLKSEEQKIKDHKDALNQIIADDVLKNIEIAQTNRDAVLKAEAIEKKNQADLYNRGISNRKQYDMAIKRSDENIAIAKKKYVEELKKVDADEIESHVKLNNAKTQSSIDTFEKEYKALYLFQKRISMSDEEYAKQFEKIAGRKYEGYDDEMKKLDELDKKIQKSLFKQIEDTYKADKIKAELILDDEKRQTALLEAKNKYNDSIKKQEKEIIDYHNQMNSEYISNTILDYENLVKELQLTKEQQIKINDDYFKTIKKDRLRELEIQNGKDKELIKNSIASQEEKNTALLELWVQYDDHRREIYDDTENERLTKEMDIQQRSENNDKQILDDKKKILDLQMKDELALAGDNENKKYEIYLKYAQMREELDTQEKEKQKANWNDIANNIVNTTANAMDAAKNLSDDYFQGELDAAQGNAKATEEIKKKQFKADKAFKLVQATMDGIRAVQSALTLPPPAGWIMAGVNAGMAAINIDKIASSKYSPDASGSSSFSAASSGSSGGSSATTTMSTPQFFTLGTNKQQAPIQKVYVLETDITKTQQTVSSIQAKATQSLNP